MSTPTRIFKTVVPLRAKWEVSDKVSVAITGGSLLIALATILWSRNILAASLPLSLGLAASSAWVLSRLNIGLDRQQRLEFDPVTSEIFRNLKDNVKLTDRLHRVDVEEKQALGELLAGKEGATHPMTLLRVLFDAPEKKGGAHTPPGDREQGYLRAFFESGSTLAYLGLQLTRCGYYRDSKERFVFTTNNVLLSQIFLFQPNTTVRLLDGTPQGQYGATFGGTVPADEPPGQASDWQERRKQAGEEDRGSDRDAVYRGTIEQFEAMGQDIREFFTAHEPPDFIAMTSSRFSLYQGPHVGSLQNRDFKENLLVYARKTEIPVLMILYDEKIESEPMTQGKCVSILGTNEARCHAPYRTPVEPGRDGIANFASSVALGQSVLVVTSRSYMDPVPQSDPPGRTLRGSSALYQLLNAKGHLYVPDGRGIDLLESGDGQVRLFVAAEGRATSGRYTSFQRRVRLLLQHGYSMKPVFQGPEPEAALSDVAG